MAKGRFIHISGSYINSSYIREISLKHANDKSKYFILFQLDDGSTRHIEHESKHSAIYFFEATIAELNR